MIDTKSRQEACLTQMAVSRNIPYECTCRQGMKPELQLMEKSPMKKPLSPVSPRRQHQLLHKQARTQPLIPLYNASSRRAIHNTMQSSHQYSRSTSQVRISFVNFVENTRTLYSRHYVECILCFVFLGI